MFQVRQKVLDEIEIKIQVGKDFESKEENKIKEIVREKLGEETKVKIDRVDQFEYSPSGKFKWVVSNL